MDYGQIYQKALTHILHASDRMHSQKSGQADVERILAHRISTTDGLGADEVAILLATLRSDEMRSYWPSIISAAFTLLPQPRGYNGSY